MCSYVKYVHCIIAFFFKYTYYALHEYNYYYAIHEKPQRETERRQQQGTALKKPEIKDKEKTEREVVRDKKEGERLKRREDEAIFSDIVI